MVLVVIFIAIAVLVVIISIPLCYTLLFILKALVMFIIVIANIEAIVKNLLILLLALLVQLLLLFSLWLVQVLDTLAMFNERERSVIMHFNWNSTYILLFGISKCFLLLGWGSFILCCWAHFHKPRNYWGENLIQLLVT